MADGCVTRRTFTYFNSLALNIQSNYGKSISFDETDSFFSWKLTWKKEDFLKCQKSNVSYGEFNFSLRLGHISFCSSFFNNSPSPKRIYYTFSLIVSRMSFKQIEQMMMRKIWRPYFDGKMPSITMMYMYILNLYCTFCACAYKMYTRSVEYVALPLFWSLSLPPSSSYFRHFLILLSSPPSILLTLRLGKPQRKIVPKILLRNGTETEYEKENWWGGKSCKKVRA